jgi:hypothetical protein
MEFLKNFQRNILEQLALIYDNICTSLIGNYQAPDLFGCLGSFFMESRMSRYCFYIDGFNVYYALQKNPAYYKYKWLNYRNLDESDKNCLD